MDDDSPSEKSPDREAPTSQAIARRKPAWLKIRLGAGAAHGAVRQSLAAGGLHTVCEEARCPNRGECWGEHGTATFLVLGTTCTRGCGFCAVKSGVPVGVGGRTGLDGIDRDEPRRVASAATHLKLRHVVITMVTRDDLPDGGAEILAATVHSIRQALPSATIEVLASDLAGRRESIEILAASRADVLSHNIETVRRLTPVVRPRADYDRSLEFLRLCRDLDPAAITKSSLMLGLGESRDEILEAMDDLRSVGVSVMNIGQYLQPSRHHLPVDRFWTPEEFGELGREGLARGFRHVESGPLVRSSYHAGKNGGSFARRSRDGGS